MAKRIYIARLVSQINRAQPRFVSGITPAAVRLHVTRNLYEIGVATPYEVAQYGGAGIKVEEAGGETAGIAFGVAAK